MNRHRRIAAALIAGTLLLFLLATSSETVSQAIREVFVVNFPDRQTIDGEVAIKGPVRQAELVAFENLTVPPVKPTDTTRLVEAGMLVTDGFPSVVLSLHGEVKGSVHKPGRVGAMLIPEQPTIELAFNEQGMVHFALEVEAAPVSSDTPFFASTQPKFTIGFRSYRVLLYNTTDKTVTANLFAYLTD